MADDPLGDPSPTARNLAAWSAHLGYQVPDPDHLRASLAAGPTLPSAFSAVARQHRDRPALTIGDLTLTHGQIDMEAARAEAGLQRMGARSGTRLVIVADSDMSVVTAYLGALRLGAIVTFAHPSSTASEVADVIVGLGADLALATGVSLGRLAEASTAAPMVGLKASDRASVELVLGAEQATEETGSLSPTDDPDSIALLAFTSGSTGRPKPVPLSHRNLLTSIRGAMAAWRWSPTDRLVHSLPIGHQHGLGGIHAALLSGSQAIIVPRFDPERLLAAVTRQEATVLFSVPAMYQRLLAVAPDQMRQLGRLRLMTSGSAPLPPDVALEVSQLTGQLPLERYGSTEAGLDVSNPYAGPRIPGTVGLALPGVEVALVDSAGQVVDEGGTGEVVLRGPQVFRGYGGEDDQPFVRGWFQTGDLGTTDGDTGHLRLVGRTKEVIITGGMNVYPSEVERALREVPGVVDAAVIGRPSARWGEAVTAFVVLRTSTPADVEAALDSKLATFKRPKAIIPVDAIPRSSMGKVRRDILESWAKGRP